MSAENETIPADVAKKLLKADLTNLARKVRDGKPLTSTERKTLEAGVATEGRSSKRFAKNQTDLAEILGVHRSTIQRWKQGNPELRRPPFSRVDGRLSIPEWSRWAKANSRFIGGDEPAKAKQILLQNERLEMQISILKGERIETGEVERMAGEMVSSAKRVLLAIPSTLAPQLVGLTVPDAEERLKEAIVEALEPLEAKPWEDS